MSNPVKSVLNWEKGLREHVSEVDAMSPSERKAASKGMRQRGAEEKRQAGAGKLERVMNSEQETIA